MCVCVCVCVCVCIRKKGHLSFNVCKQSSIHFAQQRFLTSCLCQTNPIES